MPDLTDDEQKKVLGEVLADQLKAIQESLDGLKNVPAKLIKIDEKLDTLVSHDKATRAAIKDQGKQVADHEERLLVLEAA